MMHDALANLAIAFWCPVVCHSHSNPAKAGKRSDPEMKMEARNAAIVNYWSWYLWGHAHVHFSPE